MVQRLYIKILPIQRTLNGAKCRFVLGWCGAVGGAKVDFCGNDFRKIMSSLLFFNRRFVGYGLRIFRSCNFRKILNRRGGQSSYREP